MAISFGKYIAKMTKKPKYLENLCNKINKKYLQLTVFTGKMKVCKYAWGKYALFRTRKEVE